MNADSNLVPSFKTLSPPLLLSAGAKPAVNEFAIENPVRLHTVYNFQTSHPAPASVRKRRFSVDKQFDTLYTRKVEFYVFRKQVYVAFKVGSEGIFSDKTGRDVYIQNAAALKTRKQFRFAGKNRSALFSQGTE